ncbi:hypothetical protein QAD02_019092 [Eretmocerus hayati]|uniref:Uncharacterized protein n=1 Tax=Eretmocerus hayati TaxID=131215 RepID=A0ACC2PIQ4_9HYME|nr:hypothetical protein QAD02_019092 [Eretmocerus hayati]
MTYGSNGSYYGQQHAVLDRCQHKDFKSDAKNHANDIIVLRLNEPISSKDANGTFYPIKMVDESYKMADNATITVTAAGLNEHLKPSSVELDVFKTPHQYCVSNYSDVGGPAEDQFCADRHLNREKSIFGDIEFSPCEGDKGVTAVIGNRFVAQVTNWKSNCTDNHGLPVIFTSIAHHRQFIDNCRKEFRTRQTKGWYDLPPKGVDPIEWLNRLQHQDDTTLDKVGHFLKGALIFFTGPGRI